MRLQMYAGRAGGTGNRVARFRAEHFANGGHELHEHLRGGGGRRGLEVVVRRGERSLQRGRQGERREAAR